MQVQQWEYMSITLKQHSNGNWFAWQTNGQSLNDGATGATFDEVHKLLNELGHQGWELTTSYAATPREGAYPTQPTLIFKRLVHQIS